MKILRNKYKNDLVFPIINIVLGVLIIIFQGEVLRWAAIAVGAVCLVLGIIGTINDIKRHDEGLALSFDVMLIVVGVITILFGALLVSVIRVILGIIFICYGTYKIILSILNIDIPFIFTALLISGILYLVIGIMLFVNSYVLYIILGVLLIINGILSITSNVASSKKTKTNRVENKDYIDVETKDLN